MLRGWIVKVPFNAVHFETNNNFKAFREFSHPDFRVLIAPIRNLKAVIPQRQVESMNEEVISHPAVRVDAKGSTNFSGHVCEKLHKFDRL